MIISEPGERARHTSPTEADTHGPQRKKTQCCGENKDTNTGTLKYIGKTKTQCCSENTLTDTNTETLHNKTQI